MKILGSILTLACCSFIWTISSFTFAQMRSPSAQKQLLQQSTADRDLDQLLDALGCNDDGNQNLVSLYGKLPAGKEPNSMLKAIRMDPRVRKIYGELSNMPAEEASEIVSRAFRSKLADSQRNKIRSYGLHATLFLAFQFCPRDQFNNLFDEWNRWYDETSSSILENAAKNKGISYARLIQRSHHRAAAPETLMYLNLAVMDEMEKGKTVDEALAFVRSVFEGVVPTIQFNNLFDEWNRWYDETSSSILENAAKNKGISYARLIQRSHHRAAAPETLMYLNLAVMDEMEKGKTVDEALAFVRSVFEGVVPPEYGVLDKASDIRMQPLLPFDAETPEDAEPLVMIPEFVSWDGLDAVSIEQRSRITARIKRRLEGRRSILDWPHLTTEAALEFLINRLENLRTLADDTMGLTEGAFRTGVRIQFNGASLEKPLRKVWTVEEAPDKEELLDSMHKLYQQIPESERGEWSETYREAREWINRVPMDGVKAEHRFVVSWPPKVENGAGIENSDDSDSNAQNSDSDTGLSEASIRLEIVETTALKGKPLVPDREDDND